MRIWTGAKSADSAYSVFSWIPTICQFLFPTVWAVAVAYFASYRDWIWQGYGMFGLCVIAMAAALIASITIALAGLGVRIFQDLRQSGGKSVPATAEIAVVSTTQTPVKYTAQESERLQESLFDLRQFMGGPPKAIGDLMSEVLREWQSLNHENFRNLGSKLYSLADAVESFPACISDFMENKQRHYRDQLDSALSSNQPQFTAIAFAIRREADDFGTLDMAGFFRGQPPQNALAIVFRKQVQEFAERASTWSNWIYATNECIDRMTRSLRESRTLG